MRFNTFMTRRSVTNVVWDACAQITMMMFAYGQQIECVVVVVLPLVICGTTFGRRVDSTNTRGDHNNFVHLIIAYANCFLMLCVQCRDRLMPVTGIR